jgi:acetyl-CoA acetyltransferase family protein
VPEAFICDAIRTPIGRYGGALSSVRTDDLAALPIRALMERNAKVDWAAVDDVVYGCANQAGEDNRNVGRMALLLAGFPADVPGTTVNRLCGSSMDAIAIAARAIKSGETALMIAGGVESMSRAPFVQAKATEAFSRAAKIEDTTIGWRFINPLMKAQYGVDSMPETAENVAADFKVARADQDAFALRSQQRAAAAIAAGRLAEEIVAVTIPGKKGDPTIVDRDEHPRATTIESLAKLKGIVRPDGTVTAGNASGVNDGSCAVILASEEAARKHGSHAESPRGRVRGRGRAAADHGLRPGAGDAQGARAGEALARRHGRDRTERGVRAQALAVTRDHGLADDARASTRTAARSRSAIRSARAARGSSPTALYQLRRTAGAMRCARCASAWARGSQ